MEESVDTPHPADAELVARARADDKGAFGELVERHQQMALRVALGMVANQDIARQLVQEAMLQAYLSLDHLRNNSSFKSWLYGIVLNVCRSYIRDQKVALFSWEAMVGGLRFEAIPFSATALDPQAVMEEQELHRKVLAAVNALSPKNRAATLLFYYEQLSLQEIAAMLGISVTAVKGRLHRARKRLKQRLWPIYAETAPTKQRRITMVADIPYRTVTIADVIERRQEDQRSHVVVLLDKAGRRILPIFIAPSQGEAIAFHLAERRPPRPLTYEFIASILEALEAKLEEVRVEALKDQVYYAVAKIRSGDTVQELDARPSDALALSLRMGSPIFVAEEVLEKEGMDIPEHIWETRQLDADVPIRQGIDSIVRVLEGKLQEWERKRQAARSRPPPTEEEMEQRREKARRELLDWVFGVGP